jgi:hypothetical protein
MNFHTGKFKPYTDHHSGWFQFWRFGKRGYEIWFGDRYISIYLGSK